jgi:hypothetical protein
MTARSADSLVRKLEIAARHRADKAVASLKSFANQTLTLALSHPMGEGESPDAS